MTKLPEEHQAILSALHREKARVDSEKNILEK
jgi:hypothetical protein